MARLMKDHNGRYLIEVTLARKYAHCVIKDGCLVRCKKFPLTKLIRNDQHEAGAEQYDRWWKPVTEAEYPLARAVEQFLSNPTGWTITNKARAALTALKEQKPVSEADMGDDDVTPSASAVDKPRGECGMSKTVKKLKEKKASVAGAFKTAISKGLGKERALAFVREACPGRNVPDSYYSWYKRHFEKQKKVA